MNKLVYKLTTAVSAAALLTGSVASVAFGTTGVTISGNGADSTNNANVSVSTSNTVTQSNTANIQNNVSISSTTGGNTANKNTGGDTSISTGDANVSSSVSNSANSNVASVGCNCTGDSAVTISGNGADSTNKVGLDLDNTNVVTQVNQAKVNNNVDIDSTTGGNRANSNTGGDVDITTGDASVDASVSNDVNSNVAQIGGGTGNGAMLDVMVTGNGADSKNTVDVDVDNTTVVTQSNRADISNDIDVDASTGNNRANKNTGGDTSIDTGDADVTVDVSNHANSNVLDLSDCDCAVDATVKVAGNGADSNNKVNLDLDSVTVGTQVNDFGGKGNNVDVDSTTGGNKANENTMGGTDPSVSTGDAGSDITVSTNANSNVMGDAGDITIPGLPTLGDLNGWIMLLMGHFTSH